MKLLIVTQAVDSEDSNLSFFLRWIEEFSKHFEHVEVICLRKGIHQLPSNVHVHSLGKERGQASRSTYTLRFLNLVWHLRNRYDTVFVHMNPEYVVLAGWLWRLWKKRIVLWYTHKSVDLKLRIAAFFVNAICTASRESFRLRSAKVHVMGHGIDVDAFQKAIRTPRQGTVRILTTGRLSPTKRLAEMLAALDVLAGRGINFSFTIVGTPVTSEDALYEKRLRASLLEKPYKEKVNLLGAVSHGAIPKLLAEHDVFINLSATGSMDKAVLEALAVGLPAVTTNIAFRDLLAPAGLFMEQDTPDAIANAIVRASKTDPKELAHVVRTRFALPRTIEKITQILKAS